ncbi:MAG: alpha/beta hydrolase family protein [Flavisolibacter sp.]
MKHLVLFLFFSPVLVLAQKKPLDHSVYDGWQTIGEKAISADGRWAIFTVVPQEGDGILHIQSTENGGDSIIIQRGYNVSITPDSRYVICMLKPRFRDLREARIRKKRPEDFPKDSLSVISLETKNVFTVPSVKSFRIPEKGMGWLAYQKEKTPASRSISPTQKAVDSLKKKIDSLQLLITQLKNMKAGNGADAAGDDDPSAMASSTEGSDLVLRHLLEGKEKLFKNVVDYFFSANGKELLMRIGGKSFSSNAVVLYDLVRSAADTILRGGNEFRNFALTEEGDRVAFVAERDTNARSLQKFYGVYLFNRGDDSARLLADKKSCGMELGMTVSENGNLSFSKSGSRLFFGTAPITPAKDTSMIDIDLVKLDIWNYKDDYLQTQQLFRLNTELKRNYLAVYDLTSDRMSQLGSPGIPNIIQTNEGDGNIFIALTDTGRRVESQWMGRTKNDVYALDVRTGKKFLVKKNHEGQVYASSTGNYILLYDSKAKNYFCWNGKQLKNISSGIKVPLYNEENDVPDNPAPYGVMGWHEKDSFVYVYDRYGVWKLDPDGKEEPAPVMFFLKSIGISFRNIKTDTTEKFFRSNQVLYFRVIDEKTKRSGIFSFGLSEHWKAQSLTEVGPYSYNTFLKAKDTARFLYTKENFTLSPDLYYLKTNNHQQPTDSLPGWHTTLIQFEPGMKLSALNPQQSQYNWGSAELYHWKTFDGKQATGILYKPEDFDPSKKYPMIVYFYEKLSDNIFNYQPPAPTPSRLNIPFFVSRGYLVFAPDISYTKGHPGRDAYNYVVSGTQSLTKNKWVDAKNIGVQGQSWGGYQVAYLITATHLFKAAWAGAPVVDMFSAYGGIRWESGNNRQSQYEKGQSRIGATPWQKPELYIENSPLFHLQNVTTPLVIMSNDADGAVPWYQGIEFFTAMRRLNKKVWLLNYNGEAHNLVERKNRKDIQIREQQYFDWQLKGAPEPVWLREGVPAVKKGRDWGLEY